MIDYNFKDRPDKERIEATAAEYYDIDPKMVVNFIDFQWTYRNMQKQYDELLDRFGLSESRYIILMFLRRADSKMLLPSDIAVKLGARRPTVSKLLKGMEQAGHVVKIVSDLDKRSVYFQITGSGEQILQKFIPESFLAVKNLFNYFEESDFDQLAVLLDKVKRGTTTMIKDDLENEQK